MTDQPGSARFHALLVCALQDFERRLASVRHRLTLANSDRRTTALPLSRWHYYFVTRPNAYAAMQHTFSDLRQRSGPPGGPGHCIDFNPDFPHRIHGRAPAERHPHEH